MSQFLRSTASPLQWWVMADPHRVHNRYVVFPPVFKKQVDLVFGKMRMDVLWTRSRMQGMGVDTPILEAVRYRLKIRWNGTRQPVAISGYTRDVYNTPLPFCTVKLYRTIDDSVQYIATSDADGYYQVFSPYSDNHYIVTYKTGSPDVTGATVNTLVGI